MNNTSAAITARNVSVRLRIIELTVPCQYDQFLAAPIVFEPALLPAHDPVGDRTDAGECVDVVAVARTGRARGVRPDSSLTNGR